MVDLWHCDALGSYSGFGSGEADTFLRGAQVTNAEGIAEFTTIYPGFYRGRTVHIHAKVHLDRQTVLTTQLYFDEEISAKVFARAPYDRARRPRRVQRRRRHLRRGDAADAARRGRRRRARRHDLRRPGRLSAFARLARRAGGGRANGQVVSRIAGPFIAASPSSGSRVIITRSPGRIGAAPTRRTRVRPARSIRKLPALM